ncbi:glycosyltransferase family 1 protein [Propionimicrobium sp. PCR01-08-3]|uniref:glycosyltransferase family 4 protein n=1 Tax=Propionimicrobium sp. PCR01-08-3 TaxID=3052086 RepID=UPI00255D0B30|nr:glycosyltransferase family 1 protein [Propionimicrobium sp. PCR01-08-3]WIY83248.1 glycosyltransferase family 1 protein [Propionimicrobium sp. PCR01-08-3]
MRVGFVTECFLPSVNGVTNSVLRTLEHLRDRGHEALVIAPNDPRGVPESYAGFPVVTTASVYLPWYPDMRLSTTPSNSVHKALADFAPDVVHLAAPVILGSKGVMAAAQLGVPSVALYQTEVPRYAVRYGYPAAEPIFWRHLRKVHNMATINLAPSSYTRDQLIEHGFSRVDVWGRGVDTDRFHPAKRDQSLHDLWAPNGEVVVGYMGRLGPEKQVDDLVALEGLPGVRLVIIGDGPQRAELQGRLPSAVFVGMKSGDELPRFLASLDLFVHPGESETFCQAIQEAQASGLPTIAPRRGGPIDLIDSSHNGWLYAPGDLDAMRAEVNDLAGDRFKRVTFGRTARKHVEGRTWPKLCDQLLDYYCAAIDLGVRSPAKTG